MGNFRSFPAASRNQSRLSCVGVPGTRAWLSPAATRHTDVLSAAHGSPAMCRVMPAVPPSAWSRAAVPPDTGCPFDCSPFITPSTLHPVWSNYHPGAPRHLPVYRNFVL